MRGTPREAVDISQMLSGLVDQVETIDANLVPPISDVEFKDVKLVGGYNWIEADEPSIVVPGKSLSTIVHVFPSSA